MAHLQKFTQADYPKLLMHYERAKDADGNYHKFKNQDIDLSRTFLNYNVADFQTLPQAEFMDKRLAQLKIFKRGDVKYLCDWIVTLPKILGNADERKFFDAVFRFLAGKYKQENVISAYVHKDETQPHMHFAFIPVATDKKKNIEKLCSKDICSRDDLLKFHDELDNYLTDVFGYSTGVRNGATAEGNRSIDKLKRDTAVKAIQEKREELAAARKEIDDLKCGDSITPIKEKRDVVIISNADLETANNALAKKNLSDKRLQEAKTEIQKGVDYRNTIFKQGKENRKLQTDNAALLSEKARLQAELAAMRKILTASPSLLDEFERIANLLKTIEQAELRERQLERQRQHQSQAEM
ncbi:plasmid recombination enzyme type 3 [Clostridia bacterium]|nr:plasmid recombination enzyme type 3 [Clostridia bacterium]